MLINVRYTTLFIEMEEKVTDNLDLVQVKGLLHICPRSFRYTDVVFKSVLYLNHASNFLEETEMFESTPPASPFSLVKSDRNLSDCMTSCFVYYMAWIIWSLV